jgi:hypothetical protein
MCTLYLECTRGKMCQEYIDRNMVNSRFFVLHEADLEKNIELRIKILKII